VLARNHALLGEPAAAIAHLQEAYDAGWRDPYRLASDPRWESLRGAPDFEALLARSREALATQRESVSLSAPLLR
jgi:hypothetical protein